MEKTEVEWIRLDFEELYRLGHINITASKLLSRILDAYNLRYTMLVNCSPDVGCEYFVDDEEFVEEFKGAQGWKEEEEVIEDYAIKQKARAIVELYDGYEWAAALIYEDP
jgi:hypothetical protein